MQEDGDRPKSQLRSVNYFNDYGPFPVLLGCPVTSEKELSNGDILLTWQVIVKRDGTFERVLGDDYVAENRVTKEEKNTR